MNTETAVLSPSFRRRRRCSRLFPFSTRSALLYMAFLALGMPLHRLLPTVFSSKNSIVLRNFLDAPAMFEGGYGEFALAFSACIKWETVLLALLFLFTYSYFCDFLVTLLLSYRAFTLGVALGAGEALFRSGGISVLKFTVFLCVQAMFSALLIGYASLACSLSHRLREWGRRQMLSAFLCTVWHLVRLILFILVVLILYFLAYLIIT